MKKFLAMMLAVLMLLSMATVAMADTTWNISGITNGGTFDLVKVYTNGEHAPTEEFDFSFTADTANPTTEVPTIDTKPTNTNSKITVKLPTYTKAGTYLYTMTEKSDKNTKGVVYDTAARTLKVYVENATLTKEDGTTEAGFVCQVALYKGETIQANKNDTFTNMYKYGTLEVGKQVTAGIDSHYSDEYSFTLDLTDVNDVDYTGKVYTVNGNTRTDSNRTITVKSGSNTFTLKNDEVVVFEYLPNGAKYTVQEDKEAAENKLDSHHIGSFSYTYNGQKVAKAEGTITWNEETNSPNTSSVTVLNNYEYTGDLVIEKKVTGNTANLNDTFTFTVAGVPGTADHRETDGVVYNYDTVNKTATITMPNNGKCTITLPYRTEYTVTEQTNNYQTSYTFTEEVKADNGELYKKNTESDNSTVKRGTMDSVRETVVFTNNKTTTVETGVSLDTLPYVLVLALAGAGLVLMIARKRRVQD